MALPFPNSAIDTIISNSHFPQNTVQQNRHFSPAPIFHFDSGCNVILLIHYIMCDISKLFLSTLLKLRNITNQQNAEFKKRKFS